MTCHLAQVVPVISPDLVFLPVVGILLLFLSQVSSIMTALLVPLDGTQETMSPQ